MKVHFTASAIRDLHTIDDHIAGDSPAAARRFAATLKSACMGLGRMPKRFRLDDAIGLRVRTVGAYVVFYAVTDRVEIVRILHGAQDSVAQLQKDD